MEKSFRTILSERMNAANRTSDADLPPRPRFIEPNFVTLEVPRFTGGGARPGERPYAREAAASRARGLRLRQPRPEPLVSVASLNAADQTDLAHLVALGADTLTAGLSEKRLKAAYRGLARRLHPDLNPCPIAHERLLTVRAAYERLLARLPAYQCCNSR